MAVCRDWRPVASVCCPAGRRRIAAGLPVDGWPAQISPNPRSPPMKWQIAPAGRMPVLLARTGT